jgi:hypothetical protein
MFYKVAKQKVKEWAIFEKDSNNVYWAADALTSCTWESACKKHIFKVIMNSSNYNYV